VNLVLSVTHSYATKRRIVNDSRFLVFMPPTIPQTRPVALCLRVVRPSVRVFVRAWTQTFSAWLVVD